MPEGVGERLAQGRDEVLAREFTDRRVDGPDKAVRGLEAERHGGHVDLPQHPGAQPGRHFGRSLLEREDGGADLLNGDVEFVDRLFDALPHHGHG